MFSDKIQDTVSFPINIMTIGHFPPIIFTIPEYWQFLLSLKTSSSLVTFFPSLSFDGYLTLIPVYLQGL